MARRRPLPAAATAVLDAGSVTLVAVDTGRGVHVSPQAYAWAAGRVWLLTPADSLKARSVRRRGVAGVTVRVGADDVVLTGRARLVADWPPSLDAGSALRLGAGALAYGRRNVRVAAGVALDALAGRMGVPGRRVVIAVEPVRWALLEGGEVVDADGWAPEAPPVVRRPRLAEVPLRALPRALRPLVRRATHATVGWPGPRGPVAVPAVVDDLTLGRLRVPTALTELLGEPDGEGCVTVHASPGHRPGDYRGVLLRGPLLVGARAPAGRAVTVRPTRLTWWEGYGSATAPVEPFSGAARRR